MLLTGLLRLQVAVDRFIDDVSTLAIENCLISKLCTLFRSSNVLEMSPEDLSDLAGETPESSLERQRLEAKRKILKTGLQSLKSLNKRGNVVDPIEQDQMAPEESNPVSVMTPSRSEKSPAAINSAGVLLQEIIPDEPSQSLNRVEIQQHEAVDDSPPQTVYDTEEEASWASVQKKRKNTASRQGTVEHMFETPVADKEWGY